MGRSTALNFNLRYRFTLRYISGRISTFVHTSLKKVSVRIRQTQWAATPTNWESRSDAEPETGGRGAPPMRQAARAIAKAKKRRQQNDRKINCAFRFIFGRTPTLVHTSLHESIGNTQAICVPKIPMPENWSYMEKRTEFSRGTAAEH